MKQRTKTIIGAVVLAVAAAASAQAQQQTTVQPFVPYNGSNGAGPLNPAAGNGMQNPNATGIYLFRGLQTPATRGNNAATNPACDPRSPYYNPNACR